MNNIFSNSLICLTLFIISCKGTYSPIGQYKFKEKRITATLTIDSMNKFRYNSETELIHVYSEGIWWVLKDTLFIKSNEEITKANGKVTEDFNDSIGYTLFNIFDKDGNKLENVPVIINDRDTMYSNKDGKFKFYKPVNSLFIRFFDIYDFFYTKKNNNSNNLSIYIFPIDNINEYIVLRKFLIKRRKLINNKMKMVFVRE